MIHCPFFLQDIVNRVRTTEFTSGSTATHLGLEFALQNCFTRANGSRTYASQVAIVIMEEKSDNANFSAVVAKKLRDEVKKNIDWRGIIKCGQFGKFRCIYRSLERIIIKNKAVWRVVVEETL